MLITLYIVRHGQTVDNLENRIQGHTDSPLTELGVRQAEAVADRLASESFAAIHSSDLGRAVRTAEIVASRHALPVKTTPLLRESNLGVAQGLTIEQFAERWPEECRLWRMDSTAHRPPGAETLGQVVKRCGEFIQRILAEHVDGDKLAVIAHAGSQRGLICAAFGLPVSFYRALVTANASVSIVDVGNRPSLKLLNDTCHLRGVEVTVLDADTA